MNEPYGKEEDLEEVGIGACCAEPKILRADSDSITKLATVNYPPVIAKVNFENNADITIQSTKWPSSWFRFWTKVFFGAKWEKIVIK